MTEVKICAYCDQEFTGRNKKFCSRDCLDKGVRPSKDPSELKRNKCKNCGEYCKRAGTKFCSKECSYKYRIGKPTGLKGRKQSPETIAKRVANTDQAGKEARRKQTMIDKYGVDNPSQTEEVKEKISAAHKGKPRPRSEGQQENIIASKRANGTLPHTEETKQKISDALNEFHLDPNFDRSVYISSGSNGKNSKTGYYNGLYFRSSYEEMFIKFCEKYSIRLETAANKKHCVKYLSESGKLKSYYPDFYLPECNTTVEIKPISMYNVGDVPNKTHAAAFQTENFVVLTEIDGFLYEDEWEEFYNNQVKYWFSPESTSVSL